MNVLVVNPWLPYPLTSGGDQAVFNGLSVMDNCDRVVFTYPGVSEKAQEAFELEKRLPHVKVEPFLFPAKSHGYSFLTNKKLRKSVKNWMKKYLPVLLNKITPQDPTIDFRFRVIDEAFVTHIQKLINMYQIDVVQVEMTNYIPLARHLPDSVKKVFVHHEIQYVANSLRAKQLGLGWYGQERVAFQKVEEIAMLNMYDEIVTLSSVDKQKLLKDGVKTTILSSFAVVTVPKKIPVVKTERPKVVSYVGPDLHYPNYDGVLWFLKNCWNEILKSDPEYRFQIIGRWTDERRKEILSNYANVYFLGFVEDLGEAICGTIMVVPLNIGSGIRMKILEAAQLGVPVVSTAVGAEGLPVANEEHLLIANTAKEFIEDVWRMQDKTLRDKLVASMRDLVAEKYSLEALRENRKTIYTKKVL